MPRILVVDDEKSLRLTLKAFLKGVGYEVVCAEDGEEALNVFQQGGIDVVLTDIILPRRNGTELLRVIRERASRVPVILMTGEPSLETAAAAVRGKAFDYLSKPITKEAVVAAVAAAVEEKERDDEFERLRELEKRRQEELEQLVEERTREWREANERFEHAFKFSAVGMALVSPEGKLLSVNAAVCEILGYSEEQLLSRTFMDVTHPGDWPDSARQFQALVAGECESIELNKRYLHKDGRTIWGHAVVSLVRDEDGAPAYAVAYLKDITERKQTEEALREARRGWEDIFHAIGHAAVILDPEHGVTHANRAALDLLGESEDEVRGRRCYELFHGSDTSPAQCPMEVLLESGRFETAAMEMEALGRTFLVSCTPVLDEDGGLVRIIHIATDITQRKHEEEALRQALDATTDGIWYWHFPSGKLTFSPRYYTMLGYEPDAFDATYENWADLVHPDDRARAFAVAEQYLESKPDEYENEFRLRTDSGEYRWIRTKGRIVERAADGSAMLMIGNHEDVTERRHSEERLRRKEYLLARAQDLGRIGTWELDIVSSVLVWTDETYRLFGVPIGTPLTYETFLNCVHPDDREYVAREWTSRMKIDDYDIEHRLIVNGEIRWVREKAEVTFDEDGQPVKAIGFTQDITAVKRAVGALRLNEEKYRGLLEGGREAVYRMLLPDGTYEYFSPAAQQVFGHSAEEFLSNPMLIREIMHPDSADYFEQQWTALVNGDVPPTYEYRVIDAEGCERWILQSNSGVFDSQGSIVAIEGICRDVTQQKEVEATLQTANERFERAMDAARDGLFDWNLVTNEIYYSPAWKGMLGYRNEELPDDFSVWERLTDPDDAERAWQMQQELVAGQRERFELEFRMRHKDGHWVDILSRADAVLDESGRAVRIVGTHVDITERKQAHAALARSEGMLRRAQSIGKAGAWEWDVERQEMFWSEETYRIHGFDPSEIAPGSEEHIARSLQCYAEEDRERVQRAFLRCVEQGEAYDIECRLTTVDGRHLWVRTAAQAVREGDRIVRVVGDLQDITEHKRVIETLGESEARFRSYVENAPYGVFVANAAGQYVDVNPAATAITGYSREELLGMSIPDLLHPASREAGMASFHTLRETGRITAELHYVTKGGETRDWVVAAVSLTDDTFLGFVQDTTVQRSAETALQHQKALYEEAQQLAHLGHWELDLQTMAPAWSAQVFRIFGLDPDSDEPSFAMHQKITHPDDWDLLNGAVMAAVNQGRPFDIEFRILRPDGEVRWMHAIGHVRRDDDGHVASVFGTAQDVSDRRMLQAQLRQAQKLESIGTLAGGVAHEINNPINGIMNYAQLIRDSLAGKDEQLDEIAGEIIHETERVATLVRNLLQFSRQEKQSHSPARLSDIIESTLSLIRAVIRHDQITLDVDVPADLPAIKCRSQQIQQVMMNLMTNARDALNVKYPGHDDDKVIP